VSFATIAEVFRLISAADPALGQIPQNQFGILQLVRLTATEAQKQRSSARARRLAHRQCRPGARHQGHPDAQGAHHPQGRRLQHQRRKFYSTGALFAHWVAVKALDDEGRQRLAFVRRGSRGLRIVDDWSGFGQRTTASGTVLLDQVPVDAELVVDNWRQRDVPNIQGAARS
jgi:alkylation response protein AidB-like acyl-CoA dehydrogenase